MKKILIFNWKMAPDSFEKAKRLLNSILNPKSSILNSEIVVVPPFTYLSELAGLINKTNVKLGAQDLFYENSSDDGGAYTGEISPKMLKNLGVEYVLIGHSERRKYLNETDEMLNKKILAALKARLKVILCVGEPKRESVSRNYELGKAKNYVKKQLEKDLKNSKLLIQNSKLRNHLVIAYEPVWAIGAGYSDTPEDAVEMIKYIKSILNSKFKIQNSKLLYGGSVDSKNIGDFLKYPEIDGALVGHASLKTGEVRKIIKIASEYNSG